MLEPEGFVTGCEARGKQRQVFCSAERGFGAMFLGAFCLRYGVLALIMGLKMGVNCEERL